MMRHVFLINPQAGKGRATARLVESIKAAFYQREDSFEIHLSEKPGDISGLANRAALSGGYFRLYACGGDGTLNEALSGYMKNPKKGELACLPNGSCNDLLRCFDKPSVFADLKAALNSNVIDIDVISVNDRFAINILNMGLDAEVAKNKDKFSKIPGVSGPMSYNISLAYCFFKKYGISFSVALDGELLPPPSLSILAAFCNGQAYGGGYRVAPFASLDDGLLDFCSFKYTNRLTMARNVPTLKRGKHTETPHLNDIVSYRKCKRALVESDKPIPICVDGEFFTATKLDIRVIPKAVRFCLPEGCRRIDGTEL